jgi:lactate dehydrogenase-like 2-hydroxyacid dehydrogenase
VANYAVGIDNVDLEAARVREVVVTNTTGVLTNATAEHTIGLILALLRRIGEGDRSLRRRDHWEWGPDFMVGESLERKQVLVVGPGRIGRRVGELAEAHGAQVRFAGRGDDLRATLAAADVVSLHCPLTPDTRHLVDADALASMKPTAVLVNTARGQVVDEAALVVALRDGTIAGAALDVFEHEPAVSEALLAMENVVLTPHIASATRDARLAMGMLVVSALRAVLLEGRTPENAV